ncbi:MAG: efflux transporter periplasmic adaptor subunit [unclassified Hahellaceae]|nr:efflux transporter periplasmic adaptor subunit [Hahellaceae bacterium]|tara:strand:+ start:16925 stop:18049 length:1125 start_codon:yes stop_codon:yes gene_type:complete
MKQSHVIALLATLALVVWMGFGMLSPSAGSEPAVGEDKLSADAAVKSQMLVETQTLQAEDIERTILSLGQVEPDRTVTIRSELEGRITSVPVNAGAYVEAGTVIAQMDKSEWLAALNKGQAVFNERKAAWERLRALSDKGYQSRNLIDEAYSAYQVAEAELDILKRNLRNTEIVAPFNGVIDHRAVEIGDFVTVNGAIATLVDNDPLIVTAQISQSDIDEVEVGSTAKVDFPNGRQAEGTLRFIATQAASATRTFRVEIEVPNPELSLRSGTSAEARIPTGHVTAHFISPALLTLDDAGRIGIKTVDEHNVVEFHSVKIELTETAGIWVSGLPVRAEVIAVGQGFVREGETVRTGARPADERPAQPPLPAIAAQ